MKKFLIILLSFIATVCCFVGCSTTIITQDMIRNERVIEFWHRDPSGHEPETLIKTVPINEGDTFEEIELPTYDGYTFDGWFAYYSSPHTIDKFENGSALPETGGIRVHAYYTPIPFEATFYANGIEYYSEPMSGKVQLNSYLEFMESRFRHNTYEVAQLLSNEDGEHEYQSSYLFLDGFYLDAEHTQPITNNDYASQNINIYVKYDYSPINFASYDNKYIVSRVNDSELQYLNGVLVIPKKDTYGNVVTDISANAFRHNLYIKELVLPEGLSVIEDYAFEESSLEKINIPSSVKYLGTGAFKNCSNLTNAIINTNVDFNVDTLFEGCPNLAYEEYGNAYYHGKYFMGLTSTTVTEVNLKPTCEEIPANAFKNTAIQTFTIPSSVKKIGSNAFENTSITAIVIPSSVEEMGKSAFKNCTLLQNVTINTDVHFEFNNVFENCNSIITEEYGNAYYVGNRFVRALNKDITWAKIKDDCVYIPENAFKDCTKLNRVYVPSSVTRVGKHAFYNVNTHYFACYFEGNSNDITFESGANESILESTQQLTYYYFYTMPKNIKLADNGIAYAYKDLIELTGEDAYGIVIYGYFANDEEVTIDSKYSHEGQQYDVKLIFQHIFLDNDTVKKVTVNACSIIGASAFLNAKALEEVTLTSSGYIQIGLQAFSGCEKLEKVSISTGIMLISKLAFENCNSLQEVKCPTPLKAWSDSASLIDSFDANENIASSLKTDCSNAWLFDAQYDQATVEATLRALGVL